MQAEITHQKFTAKLLNNDLFYLKYKEGALLNEADFDSSYKSFLTLAKGRPIKALIEVGRHAFFDKDIDNCPSKNGLRSRAKAIVTDNLSIRLIVNRSRHEEGRTENTKVFKSRKGALKWLASVA